MSEFAHCTTHLSERADRRCGHCGNAFCDDCLVQPFAKRPPFCKACALTAAGVRSGAALTPTRSRRELKALHRSQTKQSHRESVEAEGRRGRRSVVDTAPAASSFETEPLPDELAHAPAPPTRQRWRANPF